MPAPPEAYAVVSASDPWSGKTKFVKAQSGYSPEEKIVVAEFLRAAERGGANVRLDIGIPFRPKAWPRAGVCANLWNWRIILGFPWHTKGEHINVLEFRAYTIP